LRRDFKALRSFGGAYGFILKPLYEYIVYDMFMAVFREEVEILIRKKG